MNSANGWNFERREDGLYYCSNDHEKGDDCNWNKVPEFVVRSKKSESEFQTRRHTIFVEDNGVGGRRYISDEVGCGVCVWDTALVDIKSCN